MTYLKKLIQKNNPVQIMGVINAICALIAEKAGAKALNLSGAGIANACFGLPDLGLRDAEIIPQHIIDKAPSAELRPNQKDSDSLPDYRMLDAILYQYIERRQGPRDIINMGFEADIVNRTMKLVNMNEYKRNQFCPIIRVSPKAFGVGRRVPIVAKYLSKKNLSTFVKHDFV